MRISRFSGPGAWNRLTGSILSGSNRGPRPGSDEPENVYLFVCIFFVGLVFEYVGADMKVVSIK